MKNRMSNNSKYFMPFLFISGISGLIIVGIRSFDNIAIENDLLNIMLGCLPSFFATIGLCMLPLIIAKKQHIMAMGSVVVGLMIYEAEQYWTERTFDIYDILAIILGYVISILIFKIFEAKNELH